MSGNNAVADATEEFLNAYMPLNARAYVPPADAEARVAQSAVEIGRYLMDTARGERRMEGEMAKSGRIFFG